MQFSRLTRPYVYSAALRGGYCGRPCVAHVVNEDNYNYNYNNYYYYYYYYYDKQTTDDNTYNVLLKR